MTEKGSSKLAGVQEIATEYGLAAWQIYHKIRQQIIPKGVYMRFGSRRVLIHRERWDEWLASGASAGEDHPADRTEQLRQMEGKPAQRPLVEEITIIEGKPAQRPLVEEITIIEGKPAQRPLFEHVRVVSVRKKAQGGGGGG